MPWKLSCCHSKERSVVTRQKPLQQNDEMAHARDRNGEMVQYRHLQETKMEEKQSGERESETNSYSHLGKFLRY